MRIRSIKPCFFKDEELADLGPFAMLLFEGLWCMADRDGRLEDRPRRIKAELMPYFDQDADQILQALHDGGFINRYSIDGENYIQIVKFKEHQRITGKEAETPSRIPPSATEKQPGNTGETTETTGREGKGKEGNKKGEGARDRADEPDKAVRSMVRPTPEDVAAFFKESGGNGAKARKFFNHYTANGWKVGRNPMKDWKAAARNWIEDDDGHGPGSKNGKAPDKVSSDALMAAAE
jgi:hypothetical protein